LPPPSPSTAELAQNNATLAHLVELATEGQGTLVFAAHDEKHNNADVLGDRIEERFAAL